MSVHKKLPDIKLRISGTELPGVWAEAVESIEVKQAANTPSRCHIDFIQDKGTTAEFPTGAQLSIKVNHSPDALFQGDLIACNTSYLPNGQKRIRVEAEDALQKLKKNSVVRQVQRNTLNEYISLILSEYDLTLESCDSDAWLSNMMQWGQSDLEKLVSTINRYGFHTYLCENNLQIFDLHSGVGTKRIAFGDSLLSVEVRRDNSAVYSSVSLSRWDPASATCHVHSNKAAELPAADTQGLGTDNETKSDAILHLNCVSSNDADETEQIALATLAHSLAHEFTLSGIAEGDNALTPGTKVSLENVDEDHQRDYVLTRCTHSLNRESGYLTEIHSRPPELIEAPRLSSTLAEVVDIDDPNQRGRIQVSYPALNDVVSDWLAVLFPAAGKNKGLFMLPDVGDEVLVHFIEGDITQGIVVGGLYGDQQPPSSKNKSGRCQEYRFATGRGQQVQLDDSRGAVRLTNRDGSYLDLAPGKVTIHAETDLLIQAPGKSLVIKAQSIDFEQA